MHIGEFAKRAGVHVQTIRFYERRQLLPPPARLPSGYRDYSDGDVEKVQFIKRSQELGFTLSDIKSVLRLHDAISGHPTKTIASSKELRGIVAIATERLRSVRAKLDALKQMEQQLRTMLQTLAAAACPAAKQSNRKS